MTKTFITTVIEDGEDLVLPFPDDLMTVMNWKTGDVLEWTAHTDYATIRKIEDPTIIARMFEGQPNEASSTQ